MARPDPPGAGVAPGGGKGGIGARGHRRGSLAAERRRIDLIFRTDRQRGDFALRHLVEHKASPFGDTRITRPPGSVPTIRLPVMIERHRARVGLIGLEEDLAFAIRRDFMDLALVACSDVQVTSRIAKHRPDIFLFRVVKLSGLAVGADPVDLPVGRGRDVDLIFRIDGDGVDFERIELGDHFPFALRRYAKQLRARSAAGVQIAVESLRQRPQIRGGCIVDLRRFAARGKAGRRCESRGL